MSRLPWPMLCRVKRMTTTTTCYFCHFFSFLSPVENASVLQLLILLVPLSARYITQHFSFRLIALLLCTGCNDTDLFFSSINRSRNKAFTLWFVLADVSKKPQPQFAASAAPSLIDTSRTDGLSSHLFPTC